MLHGLSDALARYINDVTAGSEARRAGCEEVVGGRLAETKYVVCIYWGQCACLL
jgi:hypothetical protein